MSFQAWPWYGAEEQARVTEILQSGRVNYWTGNVTREFETAFAQWCGTKHAVALMNGTVALDLALKALGVGEGDHVITTPRTFIASASSIVTAGATPLFADVDSDSQNITASSIAAVLTPNTKAIICVHLAGMPCDMDPIMDLAAAHELVVIEDCAQAHGATYKGKSVGSIGQVGAWSFCQDKIMTTGGEGGMVTTDDPELWSKMWSYKDHGKSWKAVYETEHPPGPRLVHDTFGTNWRMLEMQAAIGLVQLERISDWKARRTEIAGALANTCRKYAAFRVPEVPPGIEHAYYRFYAFVEPDGLRDGWSRDRIIDEISALGVPCFHGSQSEVYLEHAFDNTGWRPTERLPVAQELGKTSIAFLVHPTLTDDDIDAVRKAIDQVLARASR
ncbi:DegT/DnrJ/EryC1/StrS aminotransferase family protein [Pelagibacterium flavum]|uniref:DegT/DnrJ/EryC1/StrS aminotransferase family protein n=1 Tax=Pelagibacterium flavum TaxID=2984530 RepID=A0ABY6IPS4_9HYPH|nr:DegT/DnrJ/EryC1/StrS aminotransferase family protein [Pelagibacterium sp. YIM 151497]UYQ72603.1 DegT/DnrJ/EryC1/StrS aminotransferase family protein [Pelagibacterium sp. YIM 151497]